MTDSKLSALAALTGAGSASGDLFYVDDVSVTTSKSMTRDELNIALHAAWTTPAFSAGDFTASGSQTWTVAAGDVTTYAHTTSGKKMTVAFGIVTTTVGGTPSTDLRIAIPASKTATKEIINPVLINDNGTFTTGYATVAAAGTYIKITRTDQANWAAATNATAVYGEITFEIN